MYNQCNTIDSTTDSTICSFLSTHAFLLGNGQTYATRGVPYYRVSRIFMSRIFHPCNMVPHGAAFSCPAISCLAFSASPPVYHTERSHLQECMWERVVQSTRASTTRRPADPPEGNTVVWACWYMWVCGSLDFVHPAHPIQHTAGCTTGCVNYANERSQAALERSSQDDYDVIMLTRAARRLCGQ